MKRFLTIFIFASVISLNAKEVFRADEISCVAYRVTKGMFFVTDVDVTGKTCTVQTNLTKEGESATVRLSFPISGLNSNNSKRDAEVRKILKEDVQKDIFFKSNLIPLSFLQNPGDATKIPVSGNLHIGGKAYPVKTEVIIKKMENEFLFAGIIHARFKDFDIEPPRVGPGGMIANTSENFEIHFRISSKKIQGL